MTLFEPLLFEPHNKFLADATLALGLAHAYAYDDIGNRKTTTTNGQTATTTPNHLNQYAQRTVPPAMDVSGAAAATVTVAVNNTPPQPTTRQGETFFKQLTVDNSVAAQNPTLTITSVKNLVGPNGEDAVTQVTKTAFLARSPETFTHDADGNLTDDARWRYTWDAENRLVALETTTLAAAAGTTRQKLEFAYDAQGRRIVKKVSLWNPITLSYQVSTQTVFLYDGWNLLAEMALNLQLSTLNLVRTYVWGQDLSGSFQGAGGVGGLISVTDTVAGVTHFATADGNGNIAALAKTTDGTVTARYDYNAFGETVATEGAFATGNPFRFSTKYTDDETGHLYYGYRCYAPQTGRWLCRDPYTEEGGANLYGFVDNAPSEWIDPLGLALYAFDGTNNDGYRDSRTNEETNVFILYNTYKGVNSAYSPGVGTNDGFLNPFGSAFGAGGQARIGDMLAKAGEFIKKSDTIADIIGFSRGAAQARAFANKLKDKYPCVQIRWMGLFDTVSSEGLPNDVNIGYKLGIPKDTGSVLHIIAGGERRAKTFTLSSINVGPSTPNPNENYRELIASEAVHSDVGGGYPTNRGIANSSLHRMWSDGKWNGVQFGNLPEAYLNQAGTPHDSRWKNDKLVEFLKGRPRVRKIYCHP